MGRAVLLFARPLVDDATVSADGPVTEAGVDKRRPVFGADGLEGGFFVCAATGDGLPLLPLIDPEEESATLGEAEDHETGVVVADALHRLVELVSCVDGLPTELREAEGACKGGSGGGGLAAASACSSGMSATGISTGGEVGPDRFVFRVVVAVRLPWAALDNGRDSRFAWSLTARLSSGTGTDASFIDCSGGDLPIYEGASCVLVEFALVFVELDCE